MKSTIQSAGRILVVDDEEKNRMLLRDSLQAKGYEVIEAVNGVEAVKSALRSPPDAILMDVMMPEMDGFEACRQLRQNPVTMRIPILMVTALGEREERLAGIKEGANDYLTKPIDLQDVILRVGNAVRMKKLFDELEERNQELQRLLVKDSSTHHLLQELSNHLSEFIELPAELQRSCGSKLDKHELLSLDRARASAMTMEQIVSTILDLRLLENGGMQLEMKPRDLCVIVRDAIETLGEGKFEREIPLESIMINCDADLVGRVVSKMAANALKTSKGGQKVRVVTNRAGKLAKVSIADNGPEIPIEYQDQIFTEFSKSSDPTQPHVQGLDMTFCKLAIELQGGKIGMNPGDARNNVFWFSFCSN